MDKYFRELLGGVEWRAVRGGGREREKDEERELEREEFRRVIRKLKEGKAMGGMEFLMRCGNMGGKKWRRGYGEYVREYGEVRGGLRNGRRGL